MTGCQQTYWSVGFMPGPSAGVLGVNGVIGPPEGFGVEGYIAPILPGAIDPGLDVP